MYLLFRIPASKGRLNISNQNGVGYGKMDRPAKIIVALVAIAVIAFFVFTKLSGWHKDKMDTAVRQEQNAWQNKTDKLEEEITALKEELTVVKGQKVPEKKLAEVFGEEPKQAEKGAEPSAEKKPGLADIERQIMAFFTYLNGRPYVQALKLEGGTYHQYQIGGGRKIILPSAD